LQGTVVADEFAIAWQHPFPARIVEQVGTHLRAKPDE
jgi:hypothetical protein